MRMSLSLCIVNGLGPPGEPPGLLGISVLSKRSPARHPLWHGRAKRYVRWPPDELRPGPFGHVYGVPRMLTPLDEVPPAIASFVDVVVAHRDDVPPVTVLVLRAAVHRSRRMIGIDEVELVPADQVDAAVEPPQNPVIPALQRLPAAALRACVDIVDEKRR